MTETERAIARLIVREITERLAFLDNVGIGYLSLERSARSLSGGEAQRIRLATQIGSSLVGVMYVLDEPSIGLHQRDNEKLIGTLDRLRDLGNTVIVVEHDEGTMLAADHLVDLGPGAGEHGGHVIAEGTPAQVAEDSASLTGQYLSGKRSIEVPARAARAERRAGRPQRPRTQPEGDRRRDPARRLLLRHRGLGLGQVDAGQRDPAPRGRQPPAPGEAAARRPRRHRRAQPDRQDHQHRPVADRPHAALQPGHLHQHLRPHPPALRPDPGGAGARLQARPLQLQRQGRPLRGLPRRRPDQDRDALPARRLRALRAVPRQALQPRDARGPLQGQEHRRRARDVGRGGGRVLRERAEDRPPPAHPARRRPRLHPPRPAGDDALRRRGAAGQARHRALQGRHRRHPLHPRRADHRPALRRRPAPARRPRPARRRRQHAWS